MLQTIDNVYYIVQLLITDTELVLGKTGRDVAVSVGTHVGVDSECNLRHHPTLCSKSLNGLKLGHRLRIETEDASVERKRNLLIGLSHTGKHNL